MGQLINLSDYRNNRAKTGKSSQRRQVMPEPTREAHMETVGFALYSFQYYKGTLKALKDHVLFIMRVGQDPGMDETFSELTPIEFPRGTVMKMAYLTRDRFRELFESDVPLTFSDKEVLVISLSEYLVYTAMTPTKLRRDSRDYIALLQRHRQESGG